MRQNTLVASFFVMTIALSPPLLADDPATRVESIAGTWRLESYKEYECKHYDDHFEPNGDPEQSFHRIARYTDGDKWILRGDGTGVCGNDKAKWTLDSTKQTFTHQLTNFLGIWCNLIKDGKVKRDGSKVLINTHDYSNGHRILSIWTLVSLDPPAPIPAPTVASPSRAAGNASTPSTQTKRALVTTNPDEPTFKPKSMTGTWKLSSRFIDEDADEAIDPEWKRFHKVGATWVLSDDGSGDCGGTTSKWVYDSSEGLLSVQIKLSTGKWAYAVSSGYVSMQGDKARIIIRGAKPVAYTLTSSSPADKPSTAVATKSKTKQDPLKKWIGTWHEPYTIVGVRGIIKIYRKPDGTLAGTYTLPEIGTADRVRVFYDSLEDFEVDAEDDNIITCTKVSSFLGLGETRKKFKLEYLEPGGGGPRFHKSPVDPADRLPNEPSDEFVKQ